MTVVVFALGIAIGVYAHMYYEETAIVEQIKRSEEIERRRKGREQE
jgi:hypothetical protein